MTKPVNTEELLGTIYAESFLIEGYIDSGVMGSVFRARQINKDRTVALKVINAELIEDQEIIARFHREMRVTAAIKHPNTVRVYQYGHTTKGELYLAMELLEGKSLDDVMLEEGPMAWRRVALIAGQIAAALQAAQGAKVVHRDLKPENIMVTRSPEFDTWVKVLDFGLAHVGEGEGEGDEQLTAYGARVGTPYYMAPEYVQTFDLDHRSDLYALGVLMFEMLTGKPPFQGGPYEVLHKHVKEAVPPLREIHPELDAPDWFEALVLQLLEKDPNKRPADAREVIERLSAHVELPVFPESRPSVPPAAPPVAKRALPLVAIAGVSAALFVVVGIVLMGAVAWYAR